MTCYCEKKALLQCEYCEKTVFCTTQCSIWYRNQHDKSCSLTRQMLYNCVINTLKEWNLEKMLKRYNNEEELIFVIIHPICLEPANVYIILFAEKENTGVVYFEQLYKLVQNMKIRGRTYNFLDCDHKGNVLEIITKKL